MRFKMSKFANNVLAFDAEVKKLKLSSFSKIQEDWKIIQDYFIERVNYLIPIAFWDERLEEISLNEGEKISKESSPSSSEYSTICGVNMGKIFERALSDALKKFNLNGKKYNSPEGDFIWHNLIVEMKGSKLDIWQGSTHSANKSPYYMLIKYELDRTKVIKEGEDYLKSLSVILTIINKGMWRGSPGKNNSRTSLQIPVGHELIMLMGGTEKYRKNSKTKLLKYFRFINEELYSPLRMFQIGN